jgi:SAM-dependent methyltransferase
MPPEAVPARTVCACCRVGLGGEEGDVPAPVAASLAPQPWQGLGPLGPVQGETGVSEADRERWEARWAAGAGEPGPPERFLVRHADALPPGPVLDAACGDGRNALWLAARGRQVVAVDVAPSAVRRLRAAAGARGLGVDARVADLGAPDALAGLGVVAALLVVRFKPAPPQWDRLLDRLAPGGRLLLCSFGREQHARTGFPLAYCLGRGELEARLEGRLRLLAYEAFEEDGEALEGSLWERPALRP